jgi:hypothetical protein
LIVVLANKQLMFYCNISVRDGLIWGSKYLQAPQRQLPWNVWVRKPMHIYLPSGKLGQHWGRVRWLPVSLLLPNQLLIARRPWDWLLLSYYIVATSNSIRLLSQHRRYGLYVVLIKFCLGRRVLKWNERTGEEISLLSTISTLFLQFHFDPLVPKQVLSVFLVSPTGPVTRVVVTNKIVVLLMPVTQTRCPDQSSWYCGCVSTVCLWFWLWCDYIIFWLNVFLKKWRFILFHKKRNESLFFNWFTSLKRHMIKDGGSRSIVAQFRSHL